MTDSRSPLAEKNLEANRRAYEAIVVTGHAFPAAREILETVRPEQLLTIPVKSGAFASALLAGLWLWNDGLEECHRIVQNPPDEKSTSTYAFWHAIMHRREGDFSNSKYWYARCVNHSALQVLAAQAPAIVNPVPADKSLLRVIAGGWNPNAFVDLAEAVSENESDSCIKIAVQLQRLEWKILWEQCLAAAV
jgi:hypothetical protein